ncbi:NAD(P)-binding protein [Coniophora puteana RWD-64-598 SS2]|uniref:NAD(P)-binding protein n=1 Tax=Coniophora puteana (strain RWD-64-598) TaxID=741705 RepID=A0A5M3MCJ0_CONPW|nr:NAD(P)-binding protein [Coniophora puteana RWD-64-598 SS2]EIW76939.1 NAD(P)-binding protein [Coniophora puteana RWD-64-598 SS2]
MSSTFPLFVVAGIGDGSGTGAATARLFAKAGYAVALISRREDALNQFKDELSGGASRANVAAFPVDEYSGKSIQSAFASIKSTFPRSPLRVALWNAGAAVWKPFLETTSEDVLTVTCINIAGAFAFAHEVLQIFTAQEPETAAEGGLAGDKQTKGTLLFSGATASVRGTEKTAAFAAGKHGIRALAQSLAKEFGKQNIHVAHAIIDGNILTEKFAHKNDPEYVKNANVRLDPSSIAEAYEYLVKQDCSSWTWELDLRPAHEQW